MIFIKKYYLDHNISYKLYKYTYNYVPTIGDIIKTIDQIIFAKTTINKIINNLNKTVIDLENIYIKPEQQLALISPYDITNIIDKSYLKSDKFIKWLNLHNENIKKIDLKFNNGKINIYDYIDCNGAFYLSKCSIIKQSSLNNIINHPHKVINFII
jgi:hypothetical protein